VPSNLSADHRHLLRTLFERETAPVLVLQSHRILTGPRLLFSLNRMGSQRTDVVWRVVGYDRRGGGHVRYEPSSTRRFTICAFLTLSCFHAPSASQLWRCA